MCELFFLLRLFSSNNNNNLSNWHFVRDLLGVVRGVGFMLLARSSDEALSMNAENSDFTYIGDVCLELKYIALLI